MTRSILIFGLGFLQRSLIGQCKALGYQTVGIDPCEHPYCEKDVDVFVQVAGQDYEGTLSVARQYNVEGVVTAATDKPLVMMARVASALDLPFFSEHTATVSTDKLLMKEAFCHEGILCAACREIHSVEELGKCGFEYPVIVKPRDNSGSRGVIYCPTSQAAQAALAEAFAQTRKGSVLVEEYVEGEEYSIEAMHYKGKTHVIQYTAKRTTQFPYNVELGHTQPADLTAEQKTQIDEIVARAGAALGFDNCPSHTELKINSRGMFVIETSPRLGGDFITSHLTPLSTGVNMEALLVKMAVGREIAPSEFVPVQHKASAVTFFCLPEGIVESIDGIERLGDVAAFWHLDLKKGDKVGRITSSLDRYGWAVCEAENMTQLAARQVAVEKILENSIVVK